MNFKFMPERHVPWDYGAVISVQVVIVGRGIWWFRQDRRR
jgi:Mg2+ and Co2+ transporter CorA